MESHEVIITALVASCFFLFFMIARESRRQNREGKFLEAEWRRLLRDIDEMDRVRDN